jgi:cytochrome oxidase assembly protein ShyY1
MLKLALTPRWIAALVGCLALGVVFALLAQWQVSRSILPGSTDNYTKTITKSINDVAEPGKPFSFIELEDKTGVLTEVIAFARQEPSKAVLIENRFQQNGYAGSWIVVPTQTREGKLFVAVGFVPVTEKAEEVLAKVRALPNIINYSALRGRYLPSEAPVSQSSSYQSLSVAQLVNDIRFGTKLTPVYTGFLALTGNSNYSRVDGVEPLSIAITKLDSGLNWLSAFYAIEWTFFGLFALFMWWRLLADAYRKEQEALLEQNS